MKAGFSPGGAGGENPALDRTFGARCVFSLGHLPAFKWVLPDSPKPSLLVFVERDICL